MGLTRQEKLRRELRDAVFRLFCVAGTIAGIVWMTRTWDDTPAECPTGKGTGAFGECLNEMIATTLYPALLKIGSGWALGAFLGVVVIRTLPGLRRPRPR